MFKFQHGVVELRRALASLNTVSSFALSSALLGPANLDWLSQIDLWCCLVCWAPWLALWGRFNPYHGKQQTVPADGSVVQRRARF
ncbi:hypothetical protein SCP_1201380 [Sparassis crispa]|uniref:Uncharacterized protein n=1 Tax=Sparassis crispa TaxID=139825 RepID=A0A401GZQ4_9APHY|nr:hypothetical protein SCP_0805520 [Sparassis crispa]XP_027618159.1 hypothetical protein SCP_1004930 [Sparassis crispa]XP_027618553.1 hypothetical protein SCP_1103170 [Sparassis crispa]XP_027618826.1 hypothetical protein SCP_1201380 [Sparassis crispa]GBE86028.1 hypothetical protein SCP_0805520 [Sparassis crispa]GBE87246.1 hypothetical protein SCP_1004930 [Sparassis crispa]GBE87640.1 hypothetical protein SCP_1103170 [Sparassis crispa]GBE87913.1 hypothetical protein SCP_1201380 [Sparassis cri